MTNTVKTTPIEGQLVEFSADDAAAIFENLLTYYPDLKEVVPIARVIANIGLYKPTRTFNGFESGEDLSKFVSSVGPYEFLNYTDVTLRTCDLSFDYDFLVFLFMLHMVIKLKSFKIKFSVSSFMHFKEKTTRNSSKSEADKLYKSLERHYTVDLKYSQSHVKFASRMLSSFVRVTDVEFEVDLVPDFFKIYASDGGHVIPVVIKEMWSSSSLEDKIKLFLKGSQFKNGVRAEFEGFCNALGFIFRDDKLDRRAKNNLKNALDNVKSSGAFKSYTFVESVNIFGKKIVKEIKFTYGKDGEEKPELSKPAKENTAAISIASAESGKVDLQMQCLLNGFSMFDEMPEDFYRNM